MYFLLLSLVCIFVLYRTAVFGIISMKEGNKLGAIGIFSFIPAILVFMTLWIMKF
ncbi:hypothetical protein GGQ92_002217 [Gracilibacillus halotolerans]|uniref:Uncharacterized protein n=1 Tax=Gracilibacillus halotolerans TaxID=74386 RepID=A0A841RLP3_9BACI|nr:hypothetical protein [Gracilibacillus halotolerans]